MNLGTEQETPAVEAFVQSLVSALGGQGVAEDGRYALGDDALAVLKDIKRWLRLHDDKHGVLDVARILADTNLVKGDLLEILSIWPEDAQEGSLMSKIALLCVDLLTQLTWPFAPDDDRELMNRHRHKPYLQKAQVSYKQAIIHHDVTQVLRTAVRAGLPAMAQPQKERSPQEDNIIKVVLYFLRNIALIEPSEDVEHDIGSDITRSTTIDAFHSQDIFDLILMIGSNMKEEYGTHDVEILDILYHVVKGIDVTRLFMDKEEVISANTKELQALMGKERGMLAGYARHAPSRHNRFGTMLWLKRDDGAKSTLFGQTAIGNEQLTMAEMDKKKTWNKPRRPKKKDEKETQSLAFDTAVPLTAVARKHLRQFVEQFLDSSFNPLFTSIRRAIEREADRILDFHKREYLYLVSWFLKAQSARRQRKTAQHSQSATAAAPDLDDYALVAAVLDQETFVLLNRLMQSAQDEKRWHDLNAGMKCFTQVLSTVQDMFESPLEDDQEIAENILNRIFYEQSTHDRIIGLLRSYNDQDFGYLDACTELSHVFLRLLEKYSKQNVDLQVRNRRRARRKKKQADNSSDEATGEVEDRALEAEDQAEALKTTSERKFDFTRFAARFINQASVDTFVAFLKFFKELSVDQLKRAHRFFYRVAFKMELGVYLLRLDIIALFNKIVKGPEGLSTENVTFTEWEELVRQVFRRLVKRMQDRPALAVELLFSKINSTAYYLEHGYEKEVPKKTQRTAAALEIKPGTDKEVGLGAAVSMLINQGKLDALAWLKDILTSAATERKAWEEAHTAHRSLETTQDAQDTTEGTPTTPQTYTTTQTPPATTTQIPHADDLRAPSIFIKPDTHERRLAIRKDKHLRLLMTVLGLLAFIENEETSAWIVPSAMTSSDLTESVERINGLEFEPPVYEEGKSAEDFIRRKTGGAPRTRAVARGMDSEDGDSASDLDAELFAPGGPTERQAPPSSARDNDKPRRRLNRHAPDTLLDESVLEERREARKNKEAEKNRKIKSQLLVRESDDETDEERDRAFFELEEERRRKYAKGVSNAAKEARMEGGVDGGKGVKGKRGRKRRVDRIGSDGDDSETEGRRREKTSKKRKSGLEALLDTEESADETDAESDGSAQQSRGKSAGRARGRNEPEVVDLSDSGSEETGPGTMNTDKEDESSTLPSSQVPSPGHQAQPPRSIDDEDVDMDSGDENGNELSDKENARPVGGKSGSADTISEEASRPTQRLRMRAFIVDSDDE